MMERSHANGVMLKERVFSKSDSDLGLEPDLQLFPVLDSHGLVVLTDSSQDGTKVLLRFGLHVYVDLVANLSAQGKQILSA